MDANGFRNSGKHSCMDNSASSRSAPILPWARPDKRLKLPAPSSYGSLLFVNSSSRRRSLGASR